MSKSGQFSRLKQLKVRLVFSVLGLKLQPVQILHRHDFKEKIKKIKIDFLKLIGMLLVYLATAPKRLKLP